MLEIHNKISRTTSLTFRCLHSSLVLVSLLLILNIFHTVLQCFYCWYWTGKCPLGRQKLLFVQWDNLMKNVKFIFTSLHLLHWHVLEAAIEKCSKYAFYNSAEKQFEKVWNSISSTVTGCSHASLLRFKSCTAWSTEFSPIFLVREFSVNAPFPQIFIAFTEKLSTRKTMTFLYFMQYYTFIYYAKNLQ